MLRCPSCHTLANPLRQLTVTPRHPYRCTGCGVEYRLGGFSIGLVVYLFIIWLLTFQVLQLLGWPTGLRMLGVFVVGIVVVWLVLPLRPLHEDAEPAETSEDED
jgi:hypothetical protein